jgi:hypothetical protein
MMKNAQELIEESLAFSAKFIKLDPRNIPI